MSCDAGGQGIPGPRPHQQDGPPSRRLLNQVIRLPRSRVSVGARSIPEPLTVTDVTAKDALSMNVIEGLRGHGENRPWSGALPVSASLVLLLRVRREPAPWVQGPSAGPGS